MKGAFLGTATLAAVALTVAVTAPLAGAAPRAPTTKPVSYAPGSEYVYSSSGKKVGTLTGSGLGTQFNTVRGEISN